MSNDAASCEQFHKRVVPYLWREMDASEIAAIDVHRRQCTECDGYFRAAEDALCLEIYGRVTGFLDGGLSPDDRAQVERHLAICDRCRAHFEFDGQVLHYVRGRLQQAAVRAGRLEHIIRAIRARIASDLDEATI